MNTSAAAIEKSILVVEDSEDDYEAILRAFEKAELKSPVLWCRTGTEALAYLDRCKAKAARPDEWPYFILLDLNMPGMDGREVLAAMKNDDVLKAIPVIVLTTSSNERDVNRCYKAGANAYMQKPIDFRAMVELVRLLKHYWFDTVLLPVNELYA